MKNGRWRKKQDEKISSKKQNGHTMDETNGKKSSRKKGVFRWFQTWVDAVCRWLRRLFFGGSRALVNEVEEKEEKVQTGKKGKADKTGKESFGPTRQIIKSFFSRPRAVIALGILVSVFLLVLIGPIFSPLDVSYVEPTQQNVGPGMGMMRVPKGLSRDVKEISSYSRFSVGLSNGGKVYVWGDTESLNYSVSQIPTALKEKRAAFVAAGYDHAVAITEDGKVYGWGQNAHGQYGAPPENNSSALLYTWAPKEVLEGFGNAQNVKSLVCGYQMTAIVTQTGEAYIWGNANSGAVNLTKLRRQIKEQSALGVGVKEIRFTAANAVALMEDGRVLTASDAFKYVRDERGELVDFEEYVEARGMRFVDVGTSSQTVALLSETGEVLVVGSSLNGEERVPTIDSEEKIVQIEGGLRHYTALTDGGKVYSWGSDEWGQAEAPDIKNAAKIFVGPFQNYALSEKGKLVAKWGLNGYLMGTDGFGRSVWNRLLNGGKMTMTIGAIAVVISSLIGIAIGCLSGYFGGWVDLVLMRFTEIVSAIPFLPFAMILSVIVQTSGLGETTRIAMMMVILGLLSWTGLARLIRGQVLAEREKEFVTAAKAMGVREGKIAFKHILPNMISVIIVSMTLDFASCMLTESSLSYLGFGVRGRPTWGNMLDHAKSSIVIQNYWWQWVFPSLFLAVVTVCINMIGDALRDVMDPKSSAER